MPPRRLPKTLPASEVEALMAMPNLACATGLRDRAILELMYRAGLRVSEVCGVHVRDIDWQARTVRLRPEVAKGGKEAVLPLDDRVFGFLERWKIERRRHANGALELFVTVRTPAGRPVTRHRVWEMLDRRARKAGVRHAHPHMLRHTFATQLLADGFNVREVQELLRHSDIRTTVAYTHIAPEELAEKLRRRRSQ